MLMLLFDLHEAGLTLFIFFSVISLVLIVSKPVAKEFEATVLEWIRAVKRIREEWREPLTIEQSSETRRSLHQSDSKRELTSVTDNRV